nr:Uncharacterised protein [Klebsiella pneumoniae]
MLIVAAHAHLPASSTLASTRSLRRSRGRSFGWSSSGGLRAGQQLLVAHPHFAVFHFHRPGAYRLFVAVARPAVAQAYPLFVQREITTGSPPTSPNSPRDSTLAVLPGSRLSRA